LIALRAAVLYQVTSGLAECPACMAATAAQQDAGLLALLLAGTGLAFLTRRYWLQLPLLLLGALLICVYAIDATVTKTLTQRLYLFDIVKFGREFGAILHFGKAFIASSAGKLALAVAVAVMIVLLLSLLPRPHRPRLALVCFCAAALLFLFGRWQPSTMQYIHYELLQNVVAANLDLGIDKPYSNEFKERIAREYTAPAPTCEAGQSLHPNIIVLAVESLSMHHSRLFGGFRDLTPRLDSIAREHTYFTNFIANGYTTDHGLIAEITGHAPVPLVGRYESADAFSGYDDPHGALPEIVHAQNYSANFFTTGDLGFLDKSKWLKSLQFDSWEGAEQPFYNGWKRRHFNAAEDKALYQRFLQWLDARQDNLAPYLAFVLTVSTHPPFINPETEQPDEAGAFRYADAQIGMFYDELSKRGFFHNGILLISGDHRSMSPLLAPEQQRFGDTALARTPLVLVTDLPMVHGAVADLFSQTDIVSSIADLTGAKTCLSPSQGVFLRATPRPPQYVLHARGDKRGAVDVYFDSQQAQIILDGDATRWIGPKPDDWRTVFDGVLLDRINRGELPQNALDLVFRAYGVPQDSNDKKK
jgi:phosphoglycerol transferase MdoB-like AlkP superfamily enzyme